MIKFSGAVNTTFFPIGFDICWRPFQLSFHCGIVSFGIYWEKKR